MSLILIFCDVPLKLDGYFQQIYNAISICEILSVVFRFSGGLRLANRMLLNPILSLKFEVQYSLVLKCLD